MNLLLQLNGDLPDWFPGHERRLYVFGCRRKPCRRKNGSIRALRAVRTSDIETTTSSAGEKANGDSKPATSIGETLFGVESRTPSQANPFASKSSSAASANPFSSPKPPPVETSTPAEAKVTSDLPETFAQKARVSSTPTSAPAGPSEPWPDDPTPYPSYYLDADKEYLDPEPEAVPSNARLDTEGGSSSAAEEKALFESSMDKTFQRFADRLAQNPEQVLRYEFAGQPLLYSKSDAVGKLLSSTSDAKVQTSSSRNGAATLEALRIPRCTSCGAARVFELQLAPHAITELEKDELSIDGMDWGTIIVGVCSQNCTEKGKVDGEVGYVEEWVGVQWEEITESMKQ